MVFDSFSFRANKDWAALCQHGFDQLNTSLSALVRANIHSFVKLSVSDLSSGFVLHLSKNEINIGRCELFRDNFTIFAKFSENFTIHVLLSVGELSEELFKSSCLLLNCGLGLL